MSEISELHDPFARYLREQKIPFIRARSDRESTIAEGCQDFTCLCANHFLAIEFKTKDGALSAKQKEWHAAMEAAGSRVHVIRDMADAIELVQAWQSTLADQSLNSGYPEQGAPRLTIRANGEHGDFVFTGVTPLRRATIADLSAIPRA